ncbi:hypothetical protein VTJ83DRAFT_999 [Remersonia thermophila]|uniref:PH domain-containing protein n=1 Tax=Remersonia thermophila TaxID=72144 RepID=A0ABR4DMT0_9PEZI
MTFEEPVQPLRLSSKSNTMPTPAKAGSALPRPLSEISPTEKRRNSPSWNQTTKMALTDSSPFQSSPLENSTATSPRMFWQNRSFNSENSFGAPTSPSPCRRSSIERLQKASRVKNSNILALEQKNEYDPTRVPHIERPLAKVQGNAFAARPFGGHQRGDSKTSIPVPTSPAKTPPSPSKAAAGPSSKAPAANPKSPPLRPTTPSKDQPSPMKSSLSSRFKSSFDPETGTWTDVEGDERKLPAGRSLHRHQKSVTFDAAPPQVNEYEMATPDLSSIGSNSREGSYDSEEDEDDDMDDHYMIHGSTDPDDSFDASLEDTEKTPVVGPEDWRHDADDGYESSPMPDDLPLPQRPFHHRTGSANSIEGPSRPPAAAAANQAAHGIGNNRMPLEERLRLMMLSDDGKSAAEAQRERRMRRAGARERTRSQTPERESQSQSQGQSQSRSQSRSQSSSRSPSAHPPSDYEEEDTVGDLSALGDYQLPERISRESILRRVMGNKAADRERDPDGHFSSPTPPSVSDRGGTSSYDPDVPIPSTESDSMVDDDDDDDDHDHDDESDDGSVIIKRDPDNEYDVDSFAGLRQRSETMDSEDYDGAKGDSEDDDTDSQYSLRDEGRFGHQVQKQELQHEQERNREEEDEDEVVDEEEPKAQQEPAEDQISTPRAASPEPSGPVPTAEVQKPSEAASQPPVTLDLHDFSQSIDSILLAKPEEPRPEPEPEKAATAPKADDAPAASERPFTPEQQLTRSLTKPEYDGSGWGDPEDAFDEPGTPESVIHHPLPDEELEAARLSPAIPEQIATVKSASGSKLKTRPSATPADLAAMREARRQVSREVVPPIPDRSRSRLSRDLSDANAGASSSETFLERHPSFKKRSLTLDLDLGLSLDQDFDRVIEAQKRGYLMRQNTKVVAASDKDTDDLRGGLRSAGNSPVKAARPQSWTVEPWNGQRKRSYRKRVPPGAGGPVPPLPGQESNAAAASQDDDMASVELATEETGERGRLFVKVMGVKDLDLPLPKNERTWFSLTLDNGVHCVTTAWLELARNAPIGQEFELVVPNDLEFQLTLNVKLEKPKPVPAPAASSKKALPSPTKASKPSKPSTFSRVFASPKKRREMEQRQKQQEEEERMLAAQARQQQMLKAAAATQQPTAWELLSPLAADDGAFARAYVCLKEHEARCFGRPYQVEVACFNEWAREEPHAGGAAPSSVKSKRGGTAAQSTGTLSSNSSGPSVARRAPYKIGKLELQLLFVPRPKGATDDDMPKSMNSCIREMRAAEERLARCWEGHLSQQGGDCPYWRRRYFKLVGTKLTAYHEATRQPRATINLANAKRLIDDRRTLTEKETTGKGGRRRRSAFAEEEEGYMFVEEGFRIRFNNGEVIDFYADSTADKEGWMKALGEVIGRDNLGALDDELSGGGGGGGGSRMKGKWCELVLKREEALRKRAEGKRVHSRTKSAIV